MNLRRTRSGWAESDLAVFVRAIRSSDAEALANHGIHIPYLVPYATIPATAQASAPAGVTIVAVTPENGNLWIDIKRGSLTGHLTVSVSPDVTAEFESYVELTLPHLQLDGTGMDCRVGRRGHYSS